MQVGDDCYFFLHQTCTKGDACTYRHVAAAKFADVCPQWLKKSCHVPGCPLKHFQAAHEKLPLDKSKIPCRWEQTPSGCTRPDCFFLHTKPHVSATLAPGKNAASTAYASVPGFAAHAAVPLTQTPLLSTPSFSQAMPRTSQAYHTSTAPPAQTMVLKSRANRVQDATTVVRSASPLLDQVRKRQHRNDAENLQTGQSLSSRLGAPLKRNKVAIASGSTENPTTTFRKHVEIQAPKRHNEEMMQPRNGREASPSVPPSILQRLHGRDTEKSKASDSSSASEVIIIDQKQEQVMRLPLLVCPLLCIPSLTDTRCVPTVIRVAPATHHALCTR
eukprot:m.464719 g.464719  ORF g.464719 m.464719 type:complete len:331 (-) comp21623_c0_seq1:1897-2889(-)